MLNDEQFEAEQVPCTRGTWVRSDLRAAFNLVAPKDNWKFPIREWVPEDKVAIVLDAIDYFAGGQGQVVAYNTQFRKAYVTAPGYYALIGA